VTVSEHAAPRQAAAVAGELAKLPAFLRRDFLVAWSYRAVFVSDVAALSFQALSFYFISLMVDPQVIPSFNGTQATYMEFVAVGIALGVFLQLGLGRVSAAIRNEQLTGTLEALLMTPTQPATIQLGSVVYELIYIPIRTALFFGAIAITFGLDFEADGLLPALAILLLFIPFVWGLGVASAAATLTFRRGSAGVGLGATLLTLFSGAYFPLELLPGWGTSIAELNPVAIAIDGMREALLGGAGWSQAGRALLVITPLSAVSLVAGFFAFRASLRRERRRGTLGLY
jgi:ABC-2 type transport system permease protein